MAERTNQVRPDLPLVSVIVCTRNRPTSVARWASWSAPAKISLADALPRFIRTTTGESVARPPGSTARSVSGESAAPQASRSDNDWPAVMKALDDIGYQGWGIAEQPGGDSPEGLRDISERMSKIFA